MNAWVLKRPFTTSMSLSSDTQQNPSSSHPIHVTDTHSSASRFKSRGGRIKRRAYTMNAWVLRRPFTTSTGLLSGIQQSPCPPTARSTQEEGTPDGKYAMNQWAVRRVFLPVYTSHLDRLRLHDQHEKRAETFGLWMDHLEHGRTSHLVYDIQSGLNRETRHPFNWSRHNTHPLQDGNENGISVRGLGSNCRYARHERAVITKYDRSADL